MHRPLPFALLGLLLAASSAAPTWAQERPADTAAVEADAEAALDNLDADAVNPEQLAEQLIDLAETPLDLNVARADELALIPALTPAAAQRIVASRRANGPFGSILELQRVEGVTPDVFVEARPYLRIGPVPEAAAAQPRRYPAPPSFRAITEGAQFDVIQRFTRRLDLGRGYADDTLRTPYEGSPVRLYTRLRARYKRRVSVSLALDKDPGEAFRWEPKSQTFGYDYVAGHAAVADFGRLRTLVVGDFTAEFGQGLALWRSSAFGKGRDVVQPLARSGRGIVPYSSTEENRFFRGLAGTVRLTPALSVSAFASRRRLDATLTPVEDAPPDGGAAQVSTFPLTGLHRTASEIERKDALGETLVGGAVEYSFARARVGAVGYHARFDRPLAPGDQPYQRFRFAGQRATMVSIYANIFLGDVLFFGEGGRAPGGAFGGLGGVSIDLPRTAEAVLLARHYPRDFASLHGYAFGESNGATQNETGIYAGLRLRPSRTWTVAGYFDQYRFPWVRFSVPRPSAGYDARLTLEHQPRPWLSYYMQLRAETRGGGASVPGRGVTLLDGLVEETRQSARLHGDYVFSPHLRLRARVEVTRAFEEDGPKEYGVVLYQDVRWKPQAWLQFDARLAFFDTDSFDARVYAYESDLLYAFSVPAFSGRGRRTYALVKVEPLERLDLQLKYAVTRFEHADTVGSGLDEVDGNRLRDVRAQVRWTF